MPEDSLAKARQHLDGAFALLDARVDELAASDPHGPLRDRLVVARECIRDALAKLEHAEQAIRGGDAEHCAQTQELPA